MSRLLGTAAHVPSHRLTLPVDKRRGAAQNLPTATHPGCRFRLVGSEQLYLTNRVLIEQAISSICRRHGLAPQDAEDFAGVVRLHLLEDDYAVLRQFQNRSTFKTYVFAVVAHRYQDWRNARWGKWRPSAEARRLGEVAVRLEQLVVRDGLTSDEAVETLRTNCGVDEAREALEELLARLPVRPARRFVSSTELQRLPDAAEPPDELLRHREATDAARGAVRALARGITALPPQDRLILHMRFQDGFSVVEIARALHLDQKPLYRRIERLLMELRQFLEREGLTAESAAEILQQRGFDGADERVNADVSAGNVRSFSTSEGAAARRRVE